MIKRLRNRFIRIATLSVAAVMILLTLILNVANFISTDTDLRETLSLIYENQGTIPVASPQGNENEGSAAPPEIPEETAAREQDKEEPPKERRQGGLFTKETPYSTRYFSLTYSEDGSLIQSNLEKIASVSEENVGEYLNAALEKGGGYHFYGTYRLFVTQTQEGDYVAIFLDCHRELRSLRTVLIWSLVADVSCILLVLLLVVLLSRRAIDPVVRSAERQKQFITDASHELKTPITVIATSLRVLEMETGQHRWIDKARGQTEKLAQLVNSLVELSRMDEEQSPLKMQDFSISEAVEETVESFRDFALERGHELQIAVSPELRYWGDEYAIRQLVSILMDNAIKYAAPGTAITLSLERDRKSVVLRTANHCETLEGLDPTRIFDRFYRADASRTGSKNGFGIGLSLARSIAEGHKGSIRAELKGDVLAFEVRLKQPSKKSKPSVS